MSGLSGRLGYYLEKDAEAWNSYDVEKVARPAGRWQEEEEDEAAYVVDNSALGSTAQGVKYRRSRSVDDAHSSVAHFDTVVWGVRVSPDWVKVGRLYLPMKVRGHLVLLRQPDVIYSDDSADDKEKRPRSARERRLAPQPRLPKPLQWDNLTECAELLLEPFFEPGSGGKYEVVSNRVAIRAKPETNAPITGCETRGAVLEMFDWDTTRRWRQVQKPSDMDFKRRVPESWALGWVMLDHPEMGPLMRPQGIKFQQEPLDPLCVAISEDNIVDVQMFLWAGLSPDVLQPDGRTPLMVAADLSRRDCCVLLLQAQADVAVKSSEGSTVLQRAVEKSEPDIRALLEALSGKEAYDEEALLVAFRRLQPETKQFGQDLLEKVEAHREEKREQLRQQEAEERRREERIKKNQERYDAARRRDEERDLHRRRLEEAAEKQRQMEEEEDEEQELARKERGGLFEVVRRKGVPVHAAASFSSMEVGVEPVRSTIELHEHDPTGRWRRAMGTDALGTLTGWACVRGQYDEEDTWVLPCD